MAFAVSRGDARTECDDVVVGGGAGGLSAALLLAQLGRRVVLVEKAPRLGGSLARFRLQGLEFDTGFHFSAGLHRGGLLTDLLRVLGVVSPPGVVSLDPDRGQVLCLERSGRSLVLPVGIARLADYLASCFPAEREGARAALADMADVCARTRMMDLRRIGEGAVALPEDGITLSAALARRVADPDLRAVLSLFCMCHGATPSEVSFASHSRVSVPLYDSVARLDGGGRALLDALCAELARVPVDVRCGCTIARFGPVADRCCRELTLSSGASIAFSNLIYTIHPADMLAALPPEAVRPAFRDRVQAFAPTIGFFAVFARLRPAAGDPDWARSIISIVPDTEFDRMLAPGWQGPGGLVVMGGDPGARRPEGEALHILETTPVSQVAAWADTRRGERPAAYEAYKRRRCEEVLARLERWYPGVRARIDVLATASALTHRDYLHSPDGSAYGIRQKAGQFNLMGRLPVRNFLAAGQSAVLPGVVGTMMTSFTVCRTLLGADRFDRWMQERLDS